MSSTVKSTNNAAHAAFSVPSITLIVFIVFLTLKCAGVISWSWWWVTSPLWITFGVVVITAVIYIAILAVRVKRFERSFISRNTNSNR